MRKAMLAVSPLLLLFTMGSTDCDAYSTVTVPASDPTAPDTYDGVWWDDTYEELVSQDANFTYHLGANASVIAVGSGLDLNGGVKRVDMYPVVTRTCCLAGACTTGTFIKPTITDSQAGSVGSSVSNGVWVGAEVSRAAQVPSCPTGFSLTAWTYRWNTVATNFSNKSRTSPTRKIVYP